jgi:hypothetical protein
MFSNKFDVRIVYVFKVGIIKIILKFYSLGVTKNFKFLIPIFSLFFPNKNCQLKKF